MIVFNPTFDPSVQFESPSRRAQAFHRKLPGYAPTPLHSLDELAKSLGVSKILLKDESGRLGLPAFKILGASWAAYCALSERCAALRHTWVSVDELAERLREYPVPVLYAATDGNHGRAVARFASMLGLRSQVYVPEGTAQARVAAIESEGASVHVVQGTYDDTVAKAARDADAYAGLLLQDNGWSGYESIPHYVVEGYSTMLWEIDDELAARAEPLPTHVLVQIGVGSLADAVVRHFCRKHPRPVIIGVEPEGAACALESVRAGVIVRVAGPHTSIMAGMNCDSPSLISFPVLQRGINCFMTISDERTREAMKRLASLGIVSGETGAAGVGALFELAGEHHRRVRDAIGLTASSRVLVFSTEGATNPELYHAIVSGHSIKNY